LLGLASVLLGACGNKGALYMPGDPSHRIAKRATLGKKPKTEAQKPAEPTRADSPTPNSAP
jgi:predicted small lipoprotein YifL